MNPEAAGAYRVWAIDNLVYGPVDLGCLLQWVVDGRVVADTWVFVDSERAWRQAKEIPPLYPHFFPGEETTLIRRKQVESIRIAPEELRQFPVFAGLGGAQLEQLCRFGELCSVGAGEAIIKKGDPGDALFFVLSGRARARLVIGFDDTTLGTIPAGDFFGEMAMFNQAIRAADIIAETEARLMRLSAASLLLMMQELPDLAAPILFGMARAMAHRISDANQRLRQELAAEFVWR